MPRAPTVPLLRLHGVAVTFPGGLRARDGLSLDLRAGEVLALLGPSGCGKSTVLRVVAGLLAADAGGPEWAEPVAPGDIGMVFQDPTLMPWASLRDNVALPLRLASGRGRAVPGAVDAALALVGLGDFARAHPRTLSGGMKMRAAVARALVTRPRVMLMDEPFAALDEIARFRLNDDLLRIRAEAGCSILFVTHSVFESVYLADRIAVMTPRPGRVAETLTVAAPARRDAAFRTSAGYAAICRRVSAALESTMEDGR